MKSNYSKPEFQIEEFLANDCVTACGQTVDGQYLFECDMSSGTMYLETNGKSGLQTDNGPLTCTNTSRQHRHSNACYEYVADQFVSNGFSACKKTHKTSNLNDFVDGYVNGTKAIILLELSNSWSNHGTYNGKYISNAHATKNLDREHYNVVKS